MWNVSIGVFEWVVGGVSAGFRLSTGVLGGVLGGVLAEVLTGLMVDPCGMRILGVRAWGF